MVKIQQAAMSPQDVVVLLKIVCYGQESWLQVQLAEALELSQPEISNSLARSRYAGLVDESGRQVRKQALLEFLQYGVAYAFPVRPGPVVRGIPTAHSGPPLNTLIESGADEYVWPSASGQLRGQAISPLYKNVVKAVKNDQELHELLALVDAIRVGRVREKQLAIEELKKRLL
jgi:DNA-binding Lrp family transcriptional regulator